MKIFRALKTNHQTQGFGVENTIPSMLPAYQGMGLRAHNGVDWACYLGEPIYWDCDVVGVVASVTQNNPTAGNGVEIITEEPTGAFKHVFWHALTDGVAVQMGQKVEPGQIIMYGDSTGMSTGNHLHRGLKPQMKDENGNYYTPNKDNGYLGCVSQDGYFTNIFIVDYINSLKQEISILQKIIETIKKLLGLLTK